MDGRRPPSSPSPAEAVLEVLRSCPRWEPTAGPTGARLWLVTGADGDPYTVGPDSCTCPAQQFRRDVPCKHRRAVSIYAAIEALVLRRLTPRPPPPVETPDAVV